MKTKRFSNSILSFIILISLMPIIPIQVNAQLSYPQNIPLVNLTNNPEDIDPGSFIGDIISAQNFIFLYAENKVFVYESFGDFNFVKTVDLVDNNQSDNVGYGKFSPLFFNTRMHVNEANFMAYYSQEKILYVLGTDLRIYAIKVDDQDTSNILVISVIERPSVISNLAPLHGKAILKFDESNKRLFCVVGGRNKTYKHEPGLFHYRDVYLGIYNIGSSGTAYNQIYSELFHLNNEQPGSSYSNAIMDLEINDLVFGTGVNEYNVFYLARNGRIDVFKIDNVNYVSCVNQIPLDFYKVGKMLYINQNGIHKILVFPYRSPAAAYEPVLSKEVHFYEIDGNNPLASGVNQILSPHKKVLDAAFLASRNELILCYSNDDLNNISTSYNSDIAIYSYDFTNNTFGSNDVQYLTTNQSLSSCDNPINFNRPLKIHPKDDFALISKKDDILKLYYSNSTNSYQSQEALSGESNYFYKSTIANNHFFVLNLAKNGFDIFDNDVYSSSIRTGYQCLNTCFNPSSNKLYLFNKLNVYNNGMSIYNLETEVIENFIELNKPIGDLIYNPYQNHILVSENSVTENKAYLKIIEDGTITNSIDLGINTHHPKEMFVAPNGYIYIAVNMRNDTPKIIILDAKDYDNVINSFTVSDLTPSTNYYNIYNADFCYNPYNRKVYAIMTTNNTTIPGSDSSIEFSSFDPYFPVLNTSHYFNSLDEVIYPGVLLEIDESGVTPLRVTEENPPDGFSGPRGIICATPDNAPDGYKGKLFINSDKLIIYDCANGDDIEVDINLNDITYNQSHNMLYGFTDKAYYDESTQQNINSLRVSEVYGINEYGISNKLYSYNGQLASVFSNPYNDLLYLHTKVDETRLGASPMSIIEFDPNNVGDPPIISFENKSHYVELDENGDHHFHNYNVTTPYIDPYQNRIYLPNGAHSNISTIDFTPNESLFLNSDPGEYDWISIPRLNRESGDPLPDAVLSGHIFPPDYLQNSELKNLPPSFYTGYEVQSVYTGYQWPQVQNLMNIFSTRGYKLKLDYDPQPDNKYLQMEGDVIAPDTPMPLYGERDNWVGYFLYREQDIFDALGLVTNYLLKIEAEEWTCVYNGPYTRDPSNTNFKEGWECSDEVHNVKYGDMVVLTPDYLPENFTFTWQGTGQRIEGQLRDHTEYFTFTETADYTPVFIEIDTTDNFSEIGAFVNDSCVGACIVLPEDSLVGIMAYIDEQSNDSLLFETWSGTKSSSNNRISNYYVFNQNKEQYEQKSIITTNLKPYYKISLKEKEIEEQSSENKILSNISIFPNPANQNLQIKYNLNNECNVNIKVYDIMGRDFCTIVSGKQPNGYNIITWELKDTNGQTIPKGVYTIIIITGKERTAKKFVVN